MAFYTETFCANLQVKQAHLEKYPSSHVLLYKTKLILEKQFNSNAIYLTD